MKAGGETLGINTAGCVYNSRMDIPDRIVTLAELRRNNGDLGQPKYVAHAGIVYDVSDCPRWRREMHERLHFPGQDLTAELEEAPHKADVFSRPCVRAVGRLEGGKG
jgi:predicted heme/steroid binding protein